MGISDSSAGANAKKPTTDDILIYGGNTVDATV